MGKSSFEGAFRRNEKELKSSKNEISDFLKEESLSERERIRLTRVLQIVDRFQPERTLKERRIDVWRGYLETVFRSLPGRKKERKPIDNADSRSYLLAEKTIASLRDLRDVDFRFDQDSDFSEDAVLNQVRSSEVKSEEVLDTSITLEYEKKNWGVERICLDGIQNHLPSDSKGEHVWVRCLVDGNWVPLEVARQDKKKIQAVRFADDGVGFDVKNLSLLYSTKANESESRGQFGEGMKMMAAAALREKLQPEMESQDWRAKPVAKGISINDTRNRKNQDVEQLSFNVQHLEGEPMIGSRTTFWRPSPAFLEEVMRIEEKVLALRRNYTPAFVGTNGEIVDRKGGDVFVKGIRVASHNTLLSYNFENVETNRDRNVVVSHRLDERIMSVVAEISDKRLIKTLLQKSILNIGAVESEYGYGIYPAHPSLWVDAFAEAFGDDAVLDTGFRIPEAFEGNPINKIRLPTCLANVMLSVGVKTDREHTPDFWEETIPTSLTLNYGEQAWDEERIMLDTVQNHLPKDSGGTFIGLRFRTKDGIWHPFSLLPDMQDDEIDSIRIYDNGRGYDSQFLGFFYSTKGEGSSSAGMFGEGLKMLSIAALRNGVDMTLQSRNWTSKPRIQSQDVDGSHIDQLVFDVLHEIKNSRIIDDPDINPSSSTTFSKLSPALLKEFRQVNKKVLAIERTNPVEQTPEGDILSLEGGHIYVREILIPGNHDLRFTYHLPDFNIKNRDRSLIERGELVSAISDIWSQVENPKVIKEFLYKANLQARDDNDGASVEFSMNFTPKSKTGWKSVLRRISDKRSRFVMCVPRIMTPCSRTYMSV